MFVLVLTLSLVALATPVGADDEASSFVIYKSPSSAPIVDGFRPPPKPWMSGNRGIDFGTQPGEQVLAAADGRVIFAGQVGGELHATVEHADGLRTSYSFVDSLQVVSGDRVRVGDVVAITKGPFHFGVRSPDGTYLDPEALLAGLLVPSIRLVPGTDQGLESLGAQERQSLLNVFLNTGAAALSVTSAWASQTTALVGHYMVELNPTTHTMRFTDALRQWIKDQQSCTESSVKVSSHNTRRLVVLVSGLGTSSDANTAWEINTQDLGYADADVIRYSYAGGQAPRIDNRAEDPELMRNISVRPLEAIAQRGFTALDSQQSVSTSADRLSTLLQSVAAAQPGVPIDVVAHSQGGVVARLALERAEAEARLPAEVKNLVAVSSPQRGAPLATGIVALGDSPGGTAALSQIRAAGIADELDNRLPALADLAETSIIIDELHRRPMPESVRFATIGGSGDLVVPGSAALDSAADFRIILPTALGKEAHGSLPSSPAATREIGLAVAGMGPSCQGLRQAATAFLTAETLRYGQAVAGATAAIAAGMLPLPPAD
ncbi:MAG: peptidoglycan DD-metalloendopeptidase family protein [Acidimicrobiales bacterium]